PRSVTLVQARYPCCGCGEQGVVAGRGFGRGVVPVREDREVQLAVRTRQVMNLETLDLLVDLSARGQQSRHHDHRAQARWHAIVKLEGGNDSGTDESRDGAIDDRDRRIGCGDYREHRENEPGPSTDLRV